MKRRATDVRPFAGQKSSGPSFKNASAVCSSASSSSASNGALSNGATSNSTAPGRVFANTLAQRLAAFTLVIHLGAGTLLTGCTQAERPPALVALDQHASGPKAAFAKEHSPQAFLRAEHLKQEAAKAHDAGENELANALIANAEAAFEHAFALARAAKAEQRQQVSKQQLAELTAGLAEVDAQQVKISAEADDLELRARVIRDAQPLPSNVKASPERELARRDAARSLLSEARLLCLAAQLLGKNAEALPKELEKIALTERSLQNANQASNIDSAVLSRAACLELLSEARKVEAGETSTMSDPLLDELSRAGYEPRRDDRGVIVVLRDLFEGNKFTQAGEHKIAELTRVAQAHPSFPLLVTVHSARAATQVEEGQAALLESTLRNGGMRAVEAQVVGGALPLVPRFAARGAALNTRVEVAFIAPSW